MSKEVVLEIGTEEMPVEFISTGEEQLGKLALSFLNKERIKFQKIETLSTPCRLILLISGLEERQMAEIKEIRGPAKDIAFDTQGKPTAQAIGFAKAQGIKVSDLVIKEENQRQYLFALHKTKGEATKKILKGLLPTLIRNLSFPKMMRWNNQGVSFGRPIRWILALWDKEPIKFALGGISSSNFSYGHKYLSFAKFKVKEAKSFPLELKKRFCLINHQERMEIIEIQGNALTKKFGGKIYAERKVLEEVSQLVEYPLCLLGKISPNYLKIPEEILIEVISHQEKCLPVKNKEGRLLPYFVIVANRKNDSSGKIKKGYERVMEARLNDAQFFYRTDLKELLGNKVEKLKGIIFQEKLGTLFDKGERLKNLADFFRQELNLSPTQLEDYHLAAKLCKTDLLTEVVGEFPNLQGLMGRHYATQFGENQAVSAAIFEHYLPRFPGDALPQTELGALLSIADRIDTLVGYFQLGLSPSGSEDPYSLRRQANGLIEVILKFELSFDLEELIEKAALLYKFSLSEKLKGVFYDFFRQRLSFILGQKGYRLDFIEAILASGWSVVPELIQKLEDLKAFSREEDFFPLLKSYQRVNNILKSVSPGKLKEKKLDETLLKEEAEKSLFQTYVQIKDKIESLSDSKKFLETLSQFSPLINNFFEKIMVMVPEENLRMNRLLLLDKIRTIFLIFADFSLIKEKEKGRGVS